MGRFQSGQMGQTVNLLRHRFGGSNPSLPTMKLVILPEEKMQSYLKYCKEKSYKSSVICDKCQKIVEVEETPYYYDKDENDVYFASLCPNCGKLIITKE